MDAPTTDLVRALREAPVLAEPDEGPVMHGHFARFNEWTKIDSVFEGRFMERLAPGAFAKTLQENRAAVKVLFNHGHDQTMGDQILGIPSTLEEDDEGARYEVPLFDGMPPLLMSGLRAGAYGASFRFRVIPNKDTWVDHPAASDHNPEGLPERTVHELQLFEFGPVTFPAYANATAGVRSLSTTDDWLRHRGLTIPATPEREPAPTTTIPEPPEHSGMTPGQRDTVLRAFSL